jgi:DNA-binding PadR family transcriptional regulator
MSTKHVILALLDVKSMSGYDLMQAMKISLNSLWAATYSQIYPTLHKLDKLDWVESHQEAGQRGRDRIVYAITEEGKKELHDWYQKEIKYLPYRDPFKLWATTIDKCSWDTIEKNVSRHIEINSERAEILTGIAEAILDNSHPLIQERLRTVSHEEVENIKKTRAPIFKMLAKQAELEIEFARSVLDLAKSIHNKS